MLMVCVIHVNLFTKAHTQIIPGKEYYYYFGIWSETVGLIGVNLYAMITGYVCILGSWRYARYVRLWVLVAFYTLVMYAVGYALASKGVIPWNAEWREIVKKVILLFAGSSYWYFAAYTGLFFLIPFINEGLKKIDKSRYRCLLLVLGILLPCMNSRSAGVLYASGYNMIWLIALYVIGAYVRLYPPDRLRSSWLIVCALLCTLQGGALDFVGRSVQTGYAWPVLVVYSVCVFIVFTRLTVNGRLFRKLITFAAPASFSVYLIHVHPWCWDRLHVAAPLLNSALECPWWFAIVGGFVIYLVCTVVDRLRIYLFNVCRIDAASDCVAGIIQTYVIRLLNKIAGKGM